MKHPPKEELDERIFTASDVVSLLKRKKIKLLQAALISWVCFFLISLLSPPQYNLEATFKEEVESSSQENPIKELLGGLSTASKAPKVSALMRSYLVLKPLIQRLGVQANVKSGGKFQKACTRIRENMQIERGKKLKDIDTFSFKNVLYEGEEPYFFRLRFDDPIHFAVLDKAGKEVTYSVLGTETKCFDVQFTLEKVPQNLECKKEYLIEVAPWAVVVDQFRSSLKIKVDKSDSSVSHLTYLHRNRHLGAEILNELMHEYRNYLKKSYETAIREELAYIHRRQEEVCRELDGTLNEYVTYQSSSLENQGWLDLEGEMSNYLACYRKNFDRMQSIEMEMTRLEKLEQQESWVGAFQEFPLYKNLSTISGEIYLLNQQKDLLKLSFHGEDEAVPRVEESIDKLQKVRQEKMATEKVLGSFIQGQIETSETAYNPFSCELKQASRADAIRLLENEVHLLSLQEKMLQEGIYFQQTSNLELEGMDLTTARTLFMEASRQLDAIQGFSASFRHLEKEMEQKDFSIGSLGSILTDNFSRKLIEETFQIAEKLKDEKHLGTKERMRGEEEIALKKKILQEHLKLLIASEEVKESLIKQKMTKLQSISLACIQQQVSVLKEQAHQIIRDSKETLQQELEVIKKNNIKLTQNAHSHFPEKWRLEKWLKIKAELGLQTIKGVAQLSESKIIGQYLYHVQSKPLDVAVVPFSPKPSYLFLKASAGTIATLFVFCVFYFLKELFRGFPSSFAKLRAMRYPLLGEISFSADGPEIEDVSGDDLETLRKMTLFLDSGEKGKIVALIAGKGPNYSYAFLKNLGRRSVRSLLIHLDFREKFQRKEAFGLLQFLRGEVEEVPVQNRYGFDEILTGGFTPYGVELLQTPAFQQLLFSLKEKYDYLFLKITGPLEESDSIALLKFVDKAIVTVTGEPTELLTPFIDWAYHEKYSRLNFIVTKKFS